MCSQVCWEKTPQRTVNHLPMTRNRRYARVVQYEESFNSLILVLKTASSFAAPWCNKVRMDGAYEETVRAHWVQGNILESKSPGWSHWYVTFFVAFMRVKGRQHRHWRWSWWPWRWPPGLDWLPVVQNSSSLQDAEHTLLQLLSHSMTTKAGAFMH